VVSTEKPTYWPSDRKESSNLMDFAVTKENVPNYIKCKSCLELSSDHSFTLITFSFTIVEKEKTTQ